MNLKELAEAGLRKLEDGELGINLDAKTESDAKYLSNFYEFRGHNVQIGKPEQKGEQGMIYPVTVLNEVSSGVVQNA